MAPLETSCNPEDTMQVSSSSVWVSHTALGSSCKTFSISQWSNLSSFAPFHPHSPAHTHLWSFTRVFDFLPWSGISESGIFQLFPASFWALWPLFLYWKAPLASAPSEWTQCCSASRCLFNVSRCQRSRHWLSVRGSVAWPLASFWCEV